MFERKKSSTISLLSIVIPCYNEEEVIEKTISQMIKLCDEVQELNVELIFVDDGSKDATRQILKKYREQDKRIQIIGFARNFGHQLAVTAGVDAANGDAVVLIDADLQDPPEVIHQMISKWRDGYDVVYGTRTHRTGESAFKLMTARAFYRILNRLSDVEIPLDTGDFRLMSRPVVDVLRAMPEKDRFIRGMVSWIGFKQMPLPYKREKRLAGESKYPLKKMVKFALDGILSFSSKPLQLSITLGMFSASISTIAIIYVMVMRLFTDVWIEGWTAIMLAVLFLGGVQLICIGIVGEYVGRIYNESKNRPLYVVDEYIGFDAPPLSARSTIIRQQ